MQNLKKFKNKTYKLFGLTIKVIYIDNVVDSDGSWLFGSVEYNGDTHTIHISTKYKDDTPVPEESMSLTLMHEFLHSILVKGQYLQNSQDEPMVEWISLCWNTLVKQGLKL